jgi:integrase
VLTPVEFRALLDRLEQRDRAMALLAGSTGLRRSELVALTWGDIAFDRCEITVRRSRVRQWFGEPKTEASGKPVPLALFDSRTRKTYPPPTGSRAQTPRAVSGPTAPETAKQNLPDKEKLSAMCPV